MAKWVKRLKLMRVSKYAIIICLLLSLVFAGFTVYCAQTGDFTIVLESNDALIAGYMREDKSDLGERLTADTLDRMRDTSYSLLSDSDYERNRIIDGLGCKNSKGKRYLCFSFVLVNMSKRAIDYSMSLEILSSAEGEGGGEIVNAMRILLIEDDDFYGGTIFANPEKSEENRQKLSDNLKDGYKEYETTAFTSDYCVFDDLWRHDFPEGGERKVTLLMWLEGCDVDCVDSLYGAKIRMQMNIYAQ